MRDITIQIERLIGNIERAWGEAARNVRSQEEYNTSTVIQFANVEMKRFIVGTFNMGHEEFQNIFMSGSPRSQVDAGVHWFVMHTSEILTREGRHTDERMLSERLHAKSEGDIEDGIQQILRESHNFHLEPISPYMYFVLGLKSALSAYAGQVNGVRVTDFKEEGDAARRKMKEIHQDLKEMTQELAEDKGFIQSCTLKIDQVRKRLHRTQEETKEFSSGIRREIDERVLPRIGGLEGSLHSINARIEKAEHHVTETREALDRMEKRSRESEIILTELEKKYKRDIERLSTLSKKFLEGEAEFLVLQKDMFRNMGGDAQALMEGLEYSSSDYRLEDAEISKRISSKVSELSTRIDTTSRYNLAIPDFWLQVMRFVLKISYTARKSSDDSFSHVSTRWQAGIEDILDGLTEIFNDKDSLKAMRAVSDVTVPSFSNPQRIWNRYTTIAIESKKTLYEQMKQYKDDATYLRIAIPSILSSAIVRCAVRHRDIPEFIWFSCVAYDEMLSLYGDLLDTMVKERIEKG
ncbi:MAG: hypothetical protein HXS51_13600 [Theionarchaea archaeon]|nr:hypothetical protein [Theionarchaea archaeon]